MAQARYTVLIPNVPGLSHAVRTYLSEGPIHVRAMNIVNGDPYAHVVAWAEESPETDSHFKQIGTYVGETANAPTISVVKEGKSGVQTWEMRNKHYVPTSTHEDLASGMDGENAGYGGQDGPDESLVPPVPTDVGPVGDHSDDTAQGFNQEMNDVVTEQIGVHQGPSTLSMKS